MGETFKLNYGDLDPGIRAEVEVLRNAGFRTTDSGDGVSKIGKMECVLPFKHVVAMTSPDSMVLDAEAARELLGEGWVVEATYSTEDKRCSLLCRPDDIPELL
jgi:hypothetical protein